MRINRILLLAIIFGLFLSSCKEDDLVGTSKLGDVVYFQDSTYSIGEADGDLMIVVYRSTSDFSQSLTVNVEVSAQYAATTSFFNAGDDASGTFTVNKSTLSFGANVSSDTLTITPVDDTQSSGVKLVTVVLSSPSISSYSLGTGSGLAFFGETVVSITDDDCPVGFDYTGSWTYVDATGVDAFPGSKLCGSFGFCDGAGETVTITEDTSDPSGTTAIITGGPFGSPYSIKFLTCEEELIALGTTDSFAGVTAWNMQQGSTGNGTYSSARLTVVGVLGSNGDWVMEFVR